MNPTGDAVQMDVDDPTNTPSRVAPAAMSVFPSSFGRDAVDEMDEDTKQAKPVDPENAIVRQLEELTKDIQKAKADIAEVEAEIANLKVTLSNQEKSNASPEDRKKTKKELHEFRKDLRTKQRLLTQYLKREARLMNQLQKNQDAGNHGARNATVPSRLTDFVARGKLEDGPHGGTFEYDSRKYLVRCCYVELYDRIIERLAHPLNPQVCVYGSAGIGKSVFALYFLLRYIRENPDSKVQYCDIKAGRHRYLVQGTAITAGDPEVLLEDAVMLWDGSSPSNQSTPVRINQKVVGLYSPRAIEFTAHEDHARLVLSRNCRSFPAPSWMSTRLDAAIHSLGRNSAIFVRCCC